MSMNWNELTARERDAVVATRIMGWRRLTVGALFDLDPKDYREDYIQSLTDSWHASDSNEAKAPIDQECDCGCHHENFSPSTDIANAWLVVERMRGNGFQLQLFAPITNGMWVAKWMNHTTGKLLHAHAPTAPEAICLAACRAMGVGV